MSDPFLAHSEISNEIYIICGKKKYPVTEQVISAMKATGRLNERSKGEWIPVSVQEPAIGGIYLVTAKHLSSGHIGTDIARRLSDDVWTFGGEELKGTEIIAWQPLPEPYKEDAENE